MKLASLREFGETYYTEKSRPSPARLRRMAERGDIPAIRVGTRWFVDIERFEANNLSTAERYFRKIMSA